MVYVKKAYQGLHYTRCQREPLEKRFAVAWQSMHGNHAFSDTLRFILNPKDIPKHKTTAVTDRERLVAATVIQWLGSAVGQGFLQKVLGKMRPRKGSHLEEKFTKAWENETTDEALKAILNPPPPYRQSPITDRDHEVARKVIAWLGTDDGQVLLKKAMQGRPPGGGKIVFARRARR